MQFFLTILYALFFFYASQVNAEVFRDFIPFLSFAEIKKNYPNGKFEVIQIESKPEDITVIKVTDNALYGEVFVRFSQLTEEWYKEKIALLESDISNKPNDSFTPLLKVLLDDYKETIKIGMDARLKTEFVKWKPERPIPLEMLTKKYGNPTKIDYENNSFMPVAYWDTEAIMAHLSDSQMLVTSIDYKFNEKDKIKALNHPKTWEGSLR